MALDDSTPDTSVSTDIKNTIKLVEDRSAPLLLPTTPDDTVLSTKLKTSELNKNQEPITAFVTSSTPIAIPTPIRPQLTRPRYSSSSISPSQIPEGMCRGQILPEGGLSAKVMSKATLGASPSSFSSAKSFVTPDSFKKSSSFMNIHSGDDATEGPKFAYEKPDTPLSSSYTKVEKADLVDSDGEGDEDEDGGVLVRCLNRSRARAKSKEKGKVMTARSLSLSPIWERFASRGEAWPAWDDQLAGELIKKPTTWGSIPFRPRVITVKARPNQCDKGLITLAIEESRRAQAEGESEA